MDRPNGAAAPCDIEPLAEFLGGRGRRGRERAAALLRRFGNLAGVMEAAAAGAPGLTPSEARRLAAVLRLWKRLDAGESRPALLSPEAVGAIVRDIAAARREHLVGLYVDAQGLLIARETVAVGTLNVAHAVPRDALEPALRLGAAALILAHNHPSGCAEPSREDLRFTDAVARGARLLGLDLYDHVIVTRSGWTSLRGRGHLDQAS